MDTFMVGSVGWKGAPEGVLLTLGPEAVRHETLVAGHTHPVILLYLFFPRGVWEEVCSR